MRNIGLESPAKGTLTRRRTSVLNTGCCKRSFMAQPYASITPGLGSFSRARKQSKDSSTNEPPETLGRSTAEQAKPGSPFAVSGSAKPRRDALGLTELTATAEDVTFLRLPEVKAITGLSKTSLYSLIREQSFPSPVPLGPRAVAWVRSEVNAWAMARVAAARSVSSATARKTPSSVRPHLRTELIKRA